MCRIRENAPSVQFSCSVMSDSLWPVDYSTPGFPVLNHLLSLLKVTFVESMMLSNHLILCHTLLLLLSIFQASGSFPVSQFFASGGQRIGVSASASVLPMNIQDWFPLGLTGLIFLQSKGLSRVFSNTTVQSINCSALSFLYSSTLTSIHDYWKKYSFY